jgi:hypothetical protein
MRYLLPVLTIFLLFNCSNIDKKTNDKDDSKIESVNIDTIKVEINDKVSLQRLYLISDQEIEKDTLIHRLFYVGKKTDSIFCIFMFDDELFNFSTKEYTCKCQKNRKKFITHYKQKGFRIFYEKGVPSFFIMRNKNDTLMIIGGSGDADYSVRDTLLPQPHYFKVGESYQSVFEKLHLSNIVKPKMKNFWVMIGHVDIIRDERFASIIKQINTKFINENANKKKCYEYSSGTSVAYALFFKDGYLKQIHFRESINDINCLYYTRVISDGYYPPEKEMIEY